MRKFKFYQINDPNKEALAYFEGDESEAIKYFCALKQLSVFAFFGLFNIIEV